ncbi:RING-type domain-containing protein [Psidium guajava]|nr:RING-type domain-containing protein [Psidium guajava]
MSGVPPPQPDKILNYPQNGVLKYLFRKKLMISDLAIGLMLTHIPSSFLIGLSRQMLDAIMKDGLTVPCYTPAMHHRVLLTFDGLEASFRFQRSGGWDEIADENRFGIGHQIDCWSLYDAEDGPHGKLSFLIQPVESRVSFHVGSDDEEFHASASGGTDTSS